MWILYYKKVIDAILSKMLIGTCSGFTTFEILPGPVQNWKCVSNKKGTIQVTWKYNKNSDLYRIE